MARFLTFDHRRHQRPTPDRTVTPEVAFDCLAAHIPRGSRTDRRSGVTHINLRPADAEGTPHRGERRSQRVDHSRVLNAQTLHPIKGDSRDAVLLWPIDYGRARGGSASFGAACS